MTLRGMMQTLWRCSERGRNGWVTPMGDVEDEEDESPSA